MNTFFENFQDVLWNDQYLELFLRTGFLQFLSHVSKNVFEKTRLRRGNGENCLNFMFFRT